MLGEHPNGEYRFRDDFSGFYEDIDIYRQECFGKHAIHPSCSTSSPGGNPVDGLPPAAHLKIITIHLGNFKNTPKHL